MIMFLLQSVAYGFIVAAMETDLKNREERVTVLFTLEERDKISLAAKVVGLKVSTYIRMKALEEFLEKRGQ